MLSRTHCMGGRGWDQRCSQHAEFQTKVFHPSSTRRSNDKHNYDLIGNMCSSLEQLNGTLLQCTRPNGDEDSGLPVMNRSLSNVSSSKKNSLSSPPASNSLNPSCEREAVQGTMGEAFACKDYFQSRCGHDHSVHVVVKEQLQRLTTHSRACVSTPLLSKTMINVNMASGSEAPY